MNRQTLVEAAAVEARRRVRPQRSSEGRDR
jgi:hypothetical protein